MPEGAMFYGMAVSVAGYSGTWIIISFVVGAVIGAAGVAVVVRKVVPNGGRGREMTVDASELRAI
ncbi:hypothetical protein F4779DRAFT_615771 [Xylariaceae sp. FL0662B]|nr:hypothetical protein F4779DRAFT_615771 [Xylariaceae sp. FL0662B]